MYRNIYIYIYTVVVKNKVMNSCQRGRRKDIKALIVTRDIVGVVPMA